MPSIIRQGASATATVLEIAAGMLRRVAGGGDRDTAPEPPAAKKPVAVKKGVAAKKPAPTVHAGMRPAPTTRTDVADPKSARKVRARQG